MMNFEKVVQALQLMGIGLEEYEYLLNDYAPNESEALLKEIEMAFLKQDKKHLTISIKSLLKQAILISP